jgi:uncharacterized protein YlxW (UPF0749 family)
MLTENNKIVNEAKESITTSLAVVKPELEGMRDNVTRLQEGAHRLHGRVEGLERTVQSSQREVSSE